MFWYIRISPNIFLPLHQNVFKFAFLANGLVHQNIPEYFLSLHQNVFKFVFLANGLVHQNIPSISNRCTSPSPLRQTTSPIQIFLPSAPKLSYIFQNSSLAILQNELDLTNPPPLQLEQRQKFYTGPSFNELHLSLTDPLGTSTSTIKLSEARSSKPNLSWCQWPEARSQWQVA